MSNEKVFDLKQPELVIDDRIAEILRQRSRKLLAEALKLEIEVFIARCKDLKNESGRRRIVVEHVISGINKTDRKGYLQKYKRG